jgi:mannose-1-phosphate guanylyltransferase/phosphomannomutase
MKAFILAAGNGTRLRPLTKEIPKPMLPILDKPVIHYTLENLKKNGFDSAVVNLHYCAEKISDYFKQNKPQIHLDFSIEKKLLGTAGAVKKNEKFFNDTFAVISGDALTDINLKEVVEFHKKKKSLATIVLKEVDFRFHYGIALTNKKSEIKAFIEKPSWSDVFDNKVNTGIYIFEPEIFKYMPRNIFFDFSMNLFPLLKKNKKKIYGFVTKDYWKDIGNIAEYKKSVFDFLDGKINLAAEIKRKNKKYINPKSNIEKNVKIFPPCFIGENVKIKQGAVIKPYSVISKGSEISGGTSLENCIVFDKVKIGRNARLINSIVYRSAKIPSNITLSDSIIL